MGGPNTAKQSLNAISMDGVISIIGFLGGFKAEEQPNFVDCLSNICTVRGLLVGSRLQFEDMNRAIEANNIKPIIDSRVFKIEQAREAYQVGHEFVSKHAYSLTQYTVSMGSEAFREGVLQHRVDYACQCKARHMPSAYSSRAAALMPFLIDTYGQLIHGAFICFG